MIVLRRKLVQALLDDVVTVEVLDEHYDVQAESNNDRMDLSHIESQWAVLHVNTERSYLAPG